MDANGQWTVGVVNERLARRLATRQDYECIKIAPDKFFVYNPDYYTELEFPGGDKFNFYVLHRKV